MAGRRWKTHLKLDPKGNLVPKSNDSGVSKKVQIFLAFIRQLERMSMPFYSWLLYSLDSGSQLTFGDVQFIVRLWRARFWSWNRNGRSASHFLWKGILFHWIVHIFTTLLVNSFLWIWHIHATSYKRVEFVRKTTWPLHWHWIPPDAQCTTFSLCWPFHRQNYPVLQWLEVPKTFKTGLDKVINI